MPILVLALLLGCGRVGFAQSSRPALTHSMKGYELYSWKLRGEWYFSLLTGTNRLKSRREVMSARRRVKGIKALKILISRLPEGEEVMWSAGLVPQMHLPPDRIIEEIKTFCERRGIMLSVNQGVAGERLRAFREGLNGARCCSSILRQLFPVALSFDSDGFSLAVMLLADRSFVGLFW